jgi:internalin A
LGFNAQSAQAQVNPDGFTRFADWCEHRDQLADSARHTVEVLLTKAETEDCDRADTILSSSTDLHLSNYQISDLAPLAPLTSLQELNLSINQIVDIEPLANLTQLQELLLGKNQIVDIAPLANLTQLTGLDLRENQIADVRTLSCLDPTTVAESD